MDDGAVPFGLINGTLYEHATDQAPGSMTSASGFLSR